MTEINSSSGGLLLLGVLSTIILWYGSKIGFFHFRPDPTWNKKISFRHLSIPFAIYFLIEFVATPIYLHYGKPMIDIDKTSQVAIISYFNFFISAAILTSFLLYFCFLNKQIRLNIWRNQTNPPNYNEDLKQTFLGWCIGFPVILFTGQLLELIVYFLFNVKEIPDQLAVYFVKMTFNYPFYFFLAILTVTIFAPLIEEILFRGFLQSWIRKYLGSTSAIILSSLSFSFFHYSFGQGLANISIIGSLFPLALILGFLYEKRGSLFSSIALHSLFNTVSILNLYFLGKLP